MNKIIFKWESLNADEYGEIRLKCEFKVAGCYIDCYLNANKENLEKETSILISDEETLNKNLSLADANNIKIDLDKNKLDLANKTSPNSITKAPSVFEWEKVETPNDKQSVKTNQLENKNEKRIPIEIEIGIPNSLVINFLNHFSKKIF